MTTMERIARQALRGALATRRQVGLSRSEPMCVYDTAEGLGLEVKFCDGNSFEGMYVKVSEAILIPTLRPPGRQAFSCGHELGHWFFKHGAKIDELRDMAGFNSAPDERLANMFASYLLMPPWAVTESFARRQLNPSACTPLEIYVVAGQLGVGYETLVQHLRYSIRALSPYQAETDY